jgi:antimicrobial peptide system SdpB family protein
VRRLTGWLGGDRARPGGVEHVLSAALRFEPRGLPLGLGRSGVAFATLTVVLFTPDSALFAYTAAHPTGVDCGGVRGLSLWCAVGAGGGALPLNRALAVAVLAVTAAGWRPRWTCLPHWYVTFSLADSMTLPNGGDQVAQILTLLLVPMCLADDRRWQWQRPPAPLPAAWRGAAYAAALTARGQAAIIYSVAAVTKVLEPTWRHGTAMYSVLHDSDYGLPPGLLRHLGGLVGSIPLIAAVTWTVPLVEIGIAVAVLGTARMRLVGLVLAVLLHGGIIVAMGLFSFGLIMIALLLVVVASAAPAARQVDGAVRVGYKEVLAGAA